MQIHNLLDWRTQLEDPARLEGQGRMRYIGITHYTSGPFGEVEAVLRARSSTSCRSTSRSTIAAAERACCRSRRSAAWR